jgi:glycosyltransferase involved in cell wall biosynthesis
MKILNRFEPDIVHCWDNIAAFHFGPISKIKNIWFINSMISSAPRVNIFSKRFLAFSVSYPFSDIILSNSKAGLDAHHVPKSKRRVIYNGFDFSRLQHTCSKDKVMKKYKLNFEKPIIGMAASFSSYKDYESYIDAAFLLKDKCIFIAVGDGSNLVKMKERVSSMKLNNFYFLGKIEDVESVINIMDIGVLMSNPEEHGEGISNFLMECMAFSKPVIASRGGGTNELIIDQKSGILIEPRNGEVLAEKIEYLLSKPKLAEEMGNAGRKRIEDYFSIELMIENTFDLYKGLIYGN